MTPGAENRGELGVNCAKAAKQAGVKKFAIVTVPGGLSVHVSKNAKPHFFGKIPKFPRD